MSGWIDNWSLLNEKIDMTDEKRLKWWRKKPHKWWKKSKKDKKSKNKCYTIKEERLYYLFIFTLLYKLKSFKWHWKWADLFIPLIHLPQVMNVEFRLHLLLPVECNEGHLTCGVPHQIQGVVDLLYHVDVLPWPQPGLLTALLKKKIIIKISK